MTLDVESLRLAIYDSLASTGSAPDTDALADRLGVEPDEVATGLRQLAAARHLALNADGEVVLAHPFSTIDLGFSVKGKHTLWWGGCVWDSFAVPHLVRDEPEVLVATTCQACGRAHAWVVGRDEPPAGDQVAHFLVPAAHMWDDVVFTCSSQRVFCDDRCLETWLAREGHERGYATDLATVWRLARGWYAGRLDRGYVRREPSAAQAYLRDVGLSGSFWGF
jgi:Alkylmercury lyase